MSRRPGFIHVLNVIIDGESNRKGLYINNVILIYVII